MYENVEPVAFAELALSLKLNIGQLDLVELSKCDMLADFIVFQPKNS